MGKRVDYERYLAAAELRNHRRAVKRGERQAARETFGSQSPEQDEAALQASSVELPCDCERE